ncbi:MAG: hypothetical protein PHN82_04750 [bacterium]|nr:hypothetical protein [bacterium]
MYGEDEFLEDTLGMMASGYDGIFKMPGDGSYRCPHCGRVGTGEDTVYWIDRDEGKFKCPECGGIIELE